MCATCITLCDGPRLAVLGMRENFFLTSLLCCENKYTLFKRQAIHQPIYHHTRIIIHDDVTHARRLEHFICSTTPLSPQQPPPVRISYCSCCRPVATAHLRVQQYEQQRNTYRVISCDNIGQCTLCGHELLYKYSGRFYRFPAGE